MAYKELTDLSPDVTVSLGGTNRKTGKTNPSKIEGYYLGSRKVEDRKKKSGYSYIHVFQTPKGSVGVWGKTDLDRKLLTVTPGTMTLAAFDKMVATPNGEMYKYKVSVDTDNTIEVSASNNDASIETGDDSGADGEEDAGTYTEEEAESDDASQEAALAAARRAKVDELLKGTKSKSKN